MQFLIVVILIIIAVILYRKYFPNSNVDLSQAGTTISGITKRLYYLIVFITIAISLWIAFTSKYSEQQDTSLAIALLAFPVARLAHMAAHWVFYGKAY